MLNKALEAFGELGDDAELGPADWPTVKRYISCLNDIEGERVHPHGASESDSNLDPMNLKDIRVRLLNGMGTFTFVSTPRVFTFIVSLCVDQFFYLEQEEPRPLYALCFCKII